MKFTSTFAAFSALFLVTACGGGGGQVESPETETSPAVTGMTIEAAVAAETRDADNKARDAFRNPAQTLTFFGVEPDMTVVEIWPGGGWYTEIIAPYLASGGGTYIAAGFDPNGASERGLARIAAFNDTFTGKPDIYGDVEVSAFSARSGPIAVSNSADVVLTFRNVHNWMSGGYTDKAFADFYDVLKPGGVLGVVEHRLPADREQDPEGRSGYVREDIVIGFAEATGFELVEVSQINANPADTADHPFGVWTLPPSARTSATREPDPDFDRTPYDAIGESDRMTLKFRKPITADGALLE
ncbi:class I SAM-dependent methyltransferase [Parvularcula sp. IMCC14364]|uniref:class I SAM-dependent methyltransferase n=1 Tax=Parvularcula sp. IMCC14364 TaxID=3067902 RepID=UPI0027406376|nr:hypothetical protein [Parvularcula sp. IMCC14364]